MRTFSTILPAKDVTMVPKLLIPTPASAAVKKKNKKKIELAVAYTAYQTKRINSNIQNNS